MTNIIQPSRRKFLTGLSALIVAPAIVRVESLMPVKSIDLADYRYIVDYMIGTDTMALRMDKALFKLPVPKYVKTLTEAEVKKLAPNMLKTFKSVEVVEGVQKSMSIHLTGAEFLSLRQPSY